MSRATEATRIGFVLFPDLTQLDLTGPWEVLTRLPGSDCQLLSHELRPVKSASGLSILPTLTYVDCPQLDIIVVPGGPGHVDAMQDPGLLEFLRQQAPQCRFLTAVCTGTLVLAAAGLLIGYRATTHWASLHRLPVFGALAAEDRVVLDRNRLTGGGVTAGIDFGFRLLSELGGVELAKEVQLQMEYAPEPPFAGHPSTADAETVETLKDRGLTFFSEVAAIDAHLASLIR
ncbi:DJ-1/PfpI family protein [Rhizobium laguerreae]|uniref:DJ-1/PfpI family protein n=1 Tax=Rhizobium laguerreae TaxID=1076926 RepID=UPI0032B1CFD0